MFTGGTLDGSPIHVSSEDVSEDTPSIAGDLHDHDDIPQEAKPRWVETRRFDWQECLTESDYYACHYRTAIIAEYLAHGYIIGDNIIAKAVDYDREYKSTSRRV